MKPPHIVCASCGFYKGREVVKIGGDETKSSKK
jgi:hypothetical protein